MEVVAELVVSGAVVEADFAEPPLRMCTTLAFTRRYFRRGSEVSSSSSSEEEEDIKFIEQGNK